MFTVDRRTEKFYTLHDMFIDCGSRDLNCALNSWGKGLWIVLDNWCRNSVWMCPSELHWQVMMMQSGRSTGLSFGQLLLKFVCSICTGTIVAGIYPSELRCWALDHSTHWFFMLFCIKYLYCNFWDDLKIALFCVLRRTAPRTDKSCSYQRPGDTSSTPVHPGF